MLLKKINSLLFILLCTCSGLYAQDSTLVGKSVIWDLDQCIAYAKKNNIQINTTRLSQQTSQQQYLLAKAAKLPNLTGSASETIAHGSNITSYSSTLGSHFTTQGSYGLNSGITLFNGGLLNNTVAQANLAVSEANYAIIQQENNITLQITQAYLQVLLDKENLIYYNDLVKTSMAQTKLEQQRYNVGSVARKDLIQLQADQATDEYTLVQGQNAERGDLLTLKQLLLVPTDTYFDIIKPDTLIAGDTTATPMKNTEANALNTFPEVKGGELGVQIAQYDIKIAKAGYLPTLSGGASVSTGYTGGAPSYFSQLNSNFYQSLGLTLAVPIFTRRTVKTQVEEAKINLEQANLNLTNTKVTLSQSVERAWLNFQNAKSQFDAAEKQYNFYKESYRIASEQLKVGVASIVDFLVQKNQFIQSQQSFVQARYNMILTLKLYDFYRGIPIKL
ncbi:MAG: TolC family protein [Mucilaginibacter sp.]